MTCHIIGDGPNAFILNQLINSLNLEHICFIIKGISDEQLQKEYQEASIFVLPNIFLGENDVEGFGMVFAEASSYGLPVIGGKSGGVVDAIDDGLTGILVVPTTESIANAISYLLDNPSIAISFGNAGYKKVRELFTTTKSSLFLDLLD